MVAVDYGAKRNILRCLADLGCKVTVVPAQTSASEVKKLDPDGVFLSNGPGDPEPCDYAIAAARELIDSGVPTFGICLGHQIIGLANGISTFKMFGGHRGINHPVINLVTGKGEISSQNHGFAVNREEVEAHPDLEIVQIHLNDQTVAGMKMKSKNCFSVQYHPESAPGPDDSRYLFDSFVGILKSGSNSKIPTPELAKN